MRDDRGGLDIAGLGLVVLAFLAAVTVSAVIATALPDRVQLISDGFFFAPGAAAAVVYRRRVRSGRVEEPYPPLNRRADARPVAGRPTGDPLQSFLATQAAGSSNSRSGRIRVYPEQFRFDPYWATDTSARSWVARREEVATVATTPLKRPIRMLRAKPLLTVTLATGLVTDFSVRNGRARADRLRSWIAAD